MQPVPLRASMTEWSAHLVAWCATAMRRAGRWLNATKDGRMVADYNEDYDPAADEAGEAALLAREFIAICRTILEPNPDGPPRE